MSNVHPSRTVKPDQLRIRLSTILIHRKDRDRIVKLKTVTKMGNLTGRRWWIKLDLGTLIHKNPKAKRTTKSVRNNASRLELLIWKKKARDMASKGNSREESRLHALITMEKVDTGTDE